MIRYTLTCPDAHAFDSWFQSGAAFDTLVAAGHVACPICGATAVSKALMAPVVRASRAVADSARPDLTAPQSDLETALAELRRQVEDNSDYVGLNFAAEARAMHDGDLPRRSIYGEARGAEAQALIEDGVPVAPLPFMPARRTN